MARRVLLDEYPLILFPTLASALGVNEALILQQFNYWIQAQENDWDGHYWTYNSYTEWQKQFSFMSKETIGRAIRKLEKTGLLISAVGPNKKKFDRTKWYRIDYIKFEEMFPEKPRKVSKVNRDGAPVNRDSAEMNQDHVNLTHSPASPSFKNEPTIPEKNTTENTTDTTDEGLASSTKKPRAPKLHSRPIFAEMQKFLGYPDKTDKDPIPNYGKEAKAINRMERRNYTEAEILEFWKKKVTARGEFVSMVYVNEDIGKNGAKPRQSAFNLPDGESLAAAAREKGLINE
jgi:hypothetical protein